MSRCVKKASFWAHGEDPVVSFILVTVKGCFSLQAMVDENPQCGFLCPSSGLLRDEQTDGGMCVFVYVCVCVYVCVGVIERV